MKKLAIGALVLLSSCSWTSRQYDSFTNWAGNMTPSKPSMPDVSIKDHYEGYPYDNNKVMTDGKTMKAVPTTAYTAPKSGKTAPAQEIVDPKTQVPSLPGQGTTGSK